jgi:hypothetical protein
MAARDNITADYLRQLLDYDPETGEFRWRARPDGNADWNRMTAGRVAGTVNNRGYRAIKIAGVVCRAHRLAWLHVYGEWPSDQIDHINRDKLDNRIANLRVVNNSENMRNLPPPALDPRTLGVTFHQRDRRYVTAIRVNGKTIPLGSFKTFPEARAARIAAEIKYFGHPSPIDYRRERRR